MDCLEAQALISAAHDGEHVDPKALAEARAHCDECEDCRAFREGLDFISAAPGPVVPDAVIDATLAAISQAAAERAAAERFEAMQREVDLLAAADVLPEPVALLAEPPVAATEAPVAAAATERPAPSERPVWIPAIGTSAKPSWIRSLSDRFSHLSDSVKWAGIGAAGALAATALIAFVIVGLSGGARPTSVAGTSETDTAATGGAGLTYAPRQSGATTTKPTAPVVTTPPDYVMFETRVYTPGALLADSSTATPTIGTLKTAFATGGGVQTVPVYASPLKDGSIVVSGPDGFRLYSPIVRRMSGKRYQLVAGGELERFGTWPTLPQRFPTPQNPDGSPTFAAAGTDSLGVSVYAPSGQPVSSGFAVAPGTSASDPAAGNPNWTWWEPIE